MQNSDILSYWSKFYDSKRHVFIITALFRATAIADSWHLQECLMELHYFSDKPRVHTQNFIDRVTSTFRGPRNLVLLTAEHQIWQTGQTIFYYVEGAQISRIEVSKIMKK